MKCAIVSNNSLPQQSGDKNSAQDSPRKDYLLLAENLEAEIIAPPTRKGKKGVNFGSFVQQAWTAFRKRNEYDIVLTMSEQVGLMLALLFKMARCNKPHVMVSHYMTPAKKSMFVKYLGVDSHISKFICYGSAQAEYLKDELGIVPEKIELILHPADSNFWKPMDVPSEKMIVSAGLLARDYETLIKAIDGLDVDVVIAANSPWMAADKDHEGTTIPDRVSFVKCTPSELRDLYARAMFVTVPLFPVNIQAGSLVIYESMAMGKAVLTTANGGNIDIVKDGETGAYVPPEDPKTMRKVISEMLNDPDRTTRMGERAREVVENGLNLDTYIENITRVVKDVYKPSSSRLPSDSSSTTNEKNSSFQTNNPDLKVSK